MILRISLKSGQMDALKRGRGGTPTSSGRAVKGSCELEQPGPVIFWMAPLSIRPVIYSFCNGKAEPPGRAGHLPWQTQLSVNVAYKPPGRAIGSPSICTSSTCLPAEAPATRLRLRKHQRHAGQQFRPGDLSAVAAVCEGGGHLRVVRMRGAGAIARQGEPNKPAIRLTK